MNTKILQRIVFGFVGLAVVGSLMLGAGAALKAGNTPPDPHYVICDSQQEVDAGLCTYEAQYAEYLQRASIYTAEMGAGGALLAIGLIGCVASGWKLKHFVA